MKAVLIATVALTIGAVSAHGQVQRFNEDFSGNNESGPPVVPGGGATVGPNSKNQAVMPTPGMEQLGERPRDALSPPPETPPGTPILPPRPAQRAPRVPQ